MICKVHFLLYNGPCNILHIISEGEMSSNLKPFGVWINGHDFLNAVLKVNMLEVQTYKSKNTAASVVQKMSPLCALLTLTSVCYRGLTFLTVSKPCFTLLLLNMGLPSHKVAWQVKTHLFQCWLFQSMRLKSQWLLKKLLHYFDVT